MAFKIIRNDITKVSADCIVNTANPLPLVGRGTDSSIYKAAGEKKLLAAREEIGVIEPGHSAWTESFDLKKKGIKYIIHTVGTKYEDGKNGELEIIRSCYSSSLNMAKKLKCKSIAIPLLATGFYGFPKELGLQIAVDEISKFLLSNEIEVVLVVYDKKSYIISEKLFDDVQSFIDKNFVDESLYDEDTSGYREWFELEEKGFNSDEELKRPHAVKEKNKKTSSSREFSALRNAIVTEYTLKKADAGLDMPVGASAGKKRLSDVDVFISSSSDSMNFQNTLQQLISERKLENSEVYTKAFIDRKFFSKIISNKNYVPKKMTVMALGLALELSPKEYENFLASAGYAFMPSSRFDLIIKYCVMKGIYNLVEVDMILDSHGENCFAPD